MSDSSDLNGDLGLSNKGDLIREERMDDSRDVVRDLAYKGYSVSEICCALDQLSLTAVERALAGLLADHEVRVNGAVGHYWRGMASSVDG